LSTGGAAQVLWALKISLLAAPEWKAQIGSILGTAKLIETRAIGGD
jgi:hypothetical protein